MDNQNIEINPGVPPNNAVSLYAQSDAMDDFPVLKAFQQYIDAEHAKARKRIIALGIFFGIFTGVIISIFVILLVNVTARNQALNDRLIEFAMNNRDRGQAAVVVQPPVQQDNSALLAVSAKLEELQRKIADDNKVREENVKKTVAPPATAKEVTAAELEVVRLKALLSAEKEKLAEEKKRQKELELEAYRRKHYPELYEPKPAKKHQSPSRLDVEDEELEDEELEAKAIKEKIRKKRKSSSKEISLDDDDAISYFDIDEEEVPETKTKKPYYSIPVEVKGSRSTWQIPND